MLMQRNPLKFTHRLQIHSALLRTGEHQGPQQGYNSFGFFFFYYSLVVSFIVTFCLIQLVLIVFASFY